MFILLAQAAQAQDEATHARAAFQRGVSAFSAGKYAEALDAFTEAYRTKPNPVVLYNIAQAEAELGKAASAVAHFERYLREAKNVNPERRADVKKEIAKLHGKESKLALDSSVNGARVLLDGTVLGLTPLGRAVPVDPGAHHLVVSREGYDDYSSDLMLPPGETIHVTARLATTRPAEPEPTVAKWTPAPEREANPPASETSVPPGFRPLPEITAQPPAESTKPQRSSPAVATRSARTPGEAPAVDRGGEHGVSRVWFWSSLGVTAAAATGAILVGSLALSESSEYNAASTPPARRQELLDSGPGLAHLADALLGATVVGAGVTLWLYYKTDWHVAPTPYGIAVAGHF
jgi:hypothetical protein